MTIKRLKYKNGKAYWVKVENPSHKSQDGLKEDLTIDGFINKYGAIYNHGDGKCYQSKRSYLEALKQKGQHIKDYK